MTRVKFVGMDFHPETKHRKSFWRVGFRLLDPYEYGQHPNQWISIVAIDELDVYRKFVEWCEGINYEVVTDE